MKWISIHDNLLDDGRIFNLAREIGCTQNEVVGMLVRLWLWGINNTDETGVINESKADIANMMHMKIDIVDMLIKYNYISVIDGKLYLDDWYNQQSIYYKKMDEKKKCAERVRKYRAKKKSKVRDNINIGCEVIKKDIAEDENKNVKKYKREKRLIPNYSEQFEKFWKIYPKKLGKIKAYEMYNERIMDGWTHEQIYKATENYSRYVRVHKTEDKYIKFAKNFLSEKVPFTDYIPSGYENDKITIIDDNPYKEWL